jgi:hypothetical protein
MHPDTRPAPTRDDRLARLTTLTGPAVTLAASVGPTDAPAAGGEGSRSMIRFRLAARYARYALTSLSAVAFGMQLGN